MPAVESHPSHADLEAFTLGRLRDDAHEVVEEHVSACSDCQRIIDQAPDDTLVALLRSAALVSGAARDANSAATLTDSATPAPAVDAGLTAAWASSAVGSAELPAALTGHPRYEPTRLLGSGGMGTVWLAQHRVMARQVAIKVIHPEFIAKAGAADRFHREAQSVARLHHPNIVAAFDAENAGTTHLLAMEYVDGVNLADLLRERGPLPIAEACDAVRQAALGLQHAFDCGLIHRDLKPHNLMRTREGTVKILDFGLAVLADANRGATGLTGANVVLGTPDYIAPEQAENSSAADIRSDIYSLGCTLYHLLTGRVPFPGESVLRKLDAHRKDEPEPIRSIRPEIPVELAAVVAKMMAKKPAERYPTPAEVAAALDPSLPARRRPRRLLVALAAGALVATAAVFAVIRLSAGKDREIVIETNDPEIEVVVKGDRIVRIADPKTGKAYQLDRTDLTLTLADDAEGLAVKLNGDQPIVLMRKGQKIAVVRLEAKAGDALSSADKARIQGTWNPVRGEVFGEPLPAEILAALRPSLTFAAERVKAKANPLGPLTEVMGAMKDKGPFPKDMAELVSKGVEGIYHLDATKSPGTIDLVYFSPIRKVLLGIYRLEGDRLTLCAAIDPDRPDERPKEFATKAGVLRVLVELKRQSPEKVGELRRFPNEDVAWCVSFSPNRQQMLIGCGAGQRLRLLDVSSGKELRSFDVSGSWSAAFSPDGKSIVNAPTGRAFLHPIEILDAATGKVRRELEADKGRVRSVVFSPDGRLIASSHGDGQLRLWDVAEGKELRAFPTHNDPIHSAAFSPDSKRLLVINPDNTLRLYDVNNGVELRTFKGHTATIHDVAVSPDGRKALSAGADRTVRLWDLETGNEARRIDCDAGGMQSIAFCPDGRRCLSGNADKALHLWDLETGKELHRFDGHEGPIVCVAVSPDGRYALSGGDDHTVRLWRLPDPPPPEKVGEVRRFSWGDQVQSVAFSPDGGLAVSGGGDGSVRLWDLSTGTEVRRLSDHGNWAWDVAFTPDGKGVISAGRDGVLRLSDVASGTEVRRFAGHTSAVQRFALSVDGRRILSGEHNGCVRLFEVESGKRLQQFTAHKGMAEALAFAPDGKTAVTGGGDDGAIALWDLESGKELRRWDAGARLTGLAFSPDGRQLLSSAKDGALRWWDAETGKELRKFAVQSETIQGLALSADGRRAVTGGGAAPTGGWRKGTDFAIRLWDVAEGKQLLSFGGHTDVVVYVAMSRDGRYALSGSIDGTFRLWRLPDPPPSGKP
jgi:uncharacterized protein (TIGR03067 family)